MRIYSGRHPNNPALLLDVVWDATRDALIRVIHEIASSVDGGIGLVCLYFIDYSLPWAEQTGYQK
jgi:hypothetical protein